MTKTPPLAPSTAGDVGSDRDGSEDYVLWAYRLLLGREPESPETLTNNPFRRDRRRLVRSFVASPEYQRANAPEWLGAGPGEPEEPLSPAADVDDALAGRFDEYALLSAYQALSQAERARLLAAARDLRGTALPRPWDQDFDGSADQADIAALFRLALGRKAAGPKEWKGNLHWLGHSLDDVVRHYLSSTGFLGRGLLKSGPPSAVELAALDGFSIYAARDDKATGGVILTGQYEPHVTAVFRSRLRPGMTVVDIGANVGYFTLLAASLVGAEGSVTAVEPNPDNVQLLEASRRHNGFDQVHVACVAAGREMGVLRLKCDWSNGVALEVDAEDQLWSSRLTPCLPLSALLPADRPIDFIKIDVEGAEYAALAGCADRLRRDRPVIVSEFSPDVLPKVSGVSGETYLGLLTSCGLGLGVIGGDGEILDFGDDIAGVMSFWSRQDEGHIDIIASRPRT